MVITSPVVLLIISEFLSLYIHASTTCRTQRLHLKPNKKKSRKIHNMNKSLFSLVLILHVFFLASSMARPTPRKLEDSTGWHPISDAFADSADKVYGSYVSLYLFLYTHSHMFHNSVIVMVILFKR